MKKFYFFAIVALGMMAGCQKQSISEGVEPEDGSPVPVTFGVSAPTIELTKGAVDGWNDQTLYIYGVDRSAETFKNNGFINNVPVKLNNLDPTYPSSYDPNHTYITTANITPDHAVEQNGEIVTDENGNPIREAYYYAADNTTYDFYGYYVADAAVDADNMPSDNPVPTETDTDVTLAIKINGTQDIMLAKADQGEDVVNQAVNVNPLRAYSAYSARRNLKPTLSFMHQLARFEFNVIGATDITISNITLQDVKTLGTLTIAGENRGIKISDESPSEDLTLEGSETPVSPTGTDTKTSVGTSIMVFPGESSYQLDFELAQTGVYKDIDVEPITLDVESFKDAENGVQHTAFTAGYKYVVTIKVYSLEQVEITAELVKWKDGGSYEYDPDNDDTWEDPDIAKQSVSYIYDYYTFATLPLFYQYAVPWNAATRASLPWIAVWFERAADSVETGYEFVISRNTGEMDENGQTIIEYATFTGALATWGEGCSYSEETHAFTYPAGAVGTEAKTALFTFSEYELGVTFEAGQTWNVAVTANGENVIADDVEIK